MRKIIKEHNLCSDDDYEVHFEYIVITEPMLFADELLQRWKGITQEELALLIDQSHDENILKFWFPRAFILRKKTKSKSGEITYYCDSSISVETGVYTRPYEIMNNNDENIYKFQSVTFKESEVDKFEKDNGYVLHEIIDKQSLHKGNTTPAETKNISQQKALAVRQEKRLDVWKPAIAAMIKVAVRCGEEGPKLRQRPDFNLMFNELDATLSGEQEKFFRACLPDEHIDRLGDARGKADPPDNV